MLDGHEGLALRGVISGLRIDAAIPGHALLVHAGVAVLIGETVEDGTVTIRDRDSLEQVRVASDQVVGWITERLG